jgi:hypothetical protein
MPTNLCINITAKPQITFPATALKALQHKIVASRPWFDLEKWRDAPKKDYVRLRD